VGYTQAQLNWDKLDLLYSTVNAAPYGCGSGCSYVSTAMEQTQKFAIGTTTMTLNVSASGIIKGENTNNTAEASSYGTGADAQFNGNSTITLTFASAVSNVKFSLYDVDDKLRVQFGALNGATAQSISLSKISGSVLTFTNNNSTTARVDAAATTVANTNTDGTVNVDIAGPVTSITLTISSTTTCSSGCGTGGTEDGSFYLSDITACVSGSFPTNYNRTGANQPFTGPVTNQPDNFIITPDNDSAFMVDPATGKTWFLFADPANTYMNSFGYDPYNKILYYISEGTTLNANNKTLKKYDFNTNTLSTVLADITTLGIPTFNSGVESAAAAFYNGSLYIGFEGGKYDNSNTRKSTVYRLDFTSGVPTSAAQVFAINSYSGSSAIHDWADFVIQDGILYNYNSRPGTTIVSYEHFDMMTGQSTTYLNPSSSLGNAFQSGLTWAGDQYSFASGALNKYNKNGTVGSNITLSSAQGLTWKTGAGDASENFRPKCDLGDAPATYDPVATSPAVHERFDSIRLGTTWDNEWVKRGVSGTDDVDDGLAYTPILPPGAASSYIAQVSVYNHSGANATLIAWLDFNNNGVFDASEAITPITVPSSASQQSFYLYWASSANTMSNGTYTYLRIRITDAAAGMTTSHPTGYFLKGEVEDYKVLVDNFPLSTHVIDFNATLKNKRTELQWTATEDNGSQAYTVERSSDNINWAMVTTVTAHGTVGTFTYQAEDPSPLKGVSYYRIRIAENSGMNRFSNVKVITNSNFVLSLQATPNPARDAVYLNVEALQNSNATLLLMNMNGSVLLSKTIRLQPGTNKIPLTLPSSVTSGSYIISVTDEGETIRQKLIVNK